MMPLQRDSVGSALAVTVRDPFDLGPETFFVNGRQYAIEIGM